MRTDETSDFDAWVTETQRNRRDLDQPGQSQNRMSMLKLNSFEAVLAKERLSTERIESGAKADIVRRAFVHLQFCTRYGVAPPPALTDLVGVLMGVKSKRNQVKDQVKFIRAYQFVAENPKASPTAIKKAIGVDSRRVKTWLKDPLFAASVAYWTAYREHNPAAKVKKTPGGA